MSTYNPQILESIYKKRIILILILFLNNTHSILVNETISNNSQADSNSLLAPILIYKTLIPKNFTCKNNPMLNLLKVPLRGNINDSLYDEAKQTDSHYCQTRTKITCCTDNTLQLLTSELSNSITSKIQIFNLNLNMFNSIINEHYRNLVSYYKLNQTLVDSLFSDYKMYINNLSTLAQTLVTYSIRFKWNSFCEFVCNPELSSCDIYNLTYLFNGTYIYDLEFDCNYTNANILQALGNFTSEMGNMKTNIEKYYNSIVFNISNIIGDLVNNQTNIAMIRSINDGKYTSIQTIGPMLCNNFTNVKSSIGNFTSLNSFTCDNLVNKFCLPFECLDDYFLQFNLDYIDNLKYVDTGEENFTKVKNIKYGEDSNLSFTISNINTILNDNKSRLQNSLSYYDTEADILINDQLNFVNLQKFICVEIYFLIYIFLIILN